MSIFEKVASAAGSVFGGGGKSLGGYIGASAQAIGTGALKSAVGAKLGPSVDAAINGATALLNGNWKGAASIALNSGIFTAKMPWLMGAASGAIFQSLPSRATGGVTPSDAKKIVQESLETNFGRKNLFIVDLMAHKVITRDLASNKADIAALRKTSMFRSANAAAYARFNLFVLDVGYSPKTLSAESHRVGSAVLDQPNGSEAISLRLTTMDDERGNVKRWFMQMADKVANKDGTFGVPADYLVQIKITHSFTTDGAPAHWLAMDGNGSSQGTQPWSTEAWFRPVSIELDLSRRDESLEEITLVFAEFDTYF